MRKTQVKAYIGASTLIVSLLSLLVCGAYAVTGQGHDFKSMACAECHQNAGKNALGASTEVREDIDAVCVKCHTPCGHGKKHLGADADTAPMKIRLPLFKNGTMSCQTCHDPHAACKDPQSGYKTQFLRMVNLKRELCLNCHRLGNKTGGALRVFFPANESFVRTGYIPLLAAAEDIDQSHITVTLNGASFPVKIQDGMIYTRLRIEDGPSRISLSAGNAVLWQGQVYALTGNEGVRYGKIQRPHQINGRDGCRGCHDEGAGWKTAADAEVDGLCGQCHETKSDGRYIHGPVAVGQCLSCHDPHGGIGPAHLKADGNSLCFSCHDRREMSSHPADTIAGLCLECHQPHAADNAAFKRTPTTAMKVEPGAEPRQE